MENERRRRGERKRDHYIVDHNFSFSLYALLIFQERKVMPVKVTHFFSCIGWGHGIEVHTGRTELITKKISPVFLEPTKFS